MEAIQSIWKNNIFMRMFGAYTLSVTGQWFDFIAMTVLFGFVWKADPLIIGLVPLMYALPNILFGQLAGTLADHKSKLSLMIGSDFAAAILTICLIFAPGPLWALPILLLRATATVFYHPAQQSMIRHVVNDDQLMKAVSLNGTVNQLGKVIGPFVGASIAAVASPMFCFAINAFGFLLSGIILLTVRGLKLPATLASGHDNGEKKGFVQSWSEGWGIIFKSRILLGSLCFALIGFSAIQIVDAQFVVLLREFAPSQPALTGWVVAAVGGGSLIVVVLFNKVKDITHYGWALGGSAALLGIMLTWLGLLSTGTSVIWAIIGAVIGGLGNGLSAVSFNYLLQKETPKEAIGRVSGFFNSVMSAIMLAAPLLGGVLVREFGSGATFQIVGYFVGSVGLLGIIFERVIWKEKEHSVSNKEVAAEI